MATERGLLERCPQCGGDIVCEMMSLTGEAECSQCGLDDGQWPIFQRYRCSKCGEFMVIKTHGVGA